MLRARLDAYGGHTCGRHVPPRHGLFPLLRWRKISWRWRFLTSTNSYELSPKCSYTSTPSKVLVCNSDICSFQGRQRHVERTSALRWCCEVNPVNPFVVLCVGVLLRLATTPNATRRTRTGRDCLAAQRERFPLCQQFPADHRLALLLLARLTVYRAVFCRISGHTPLLLSQLILTEFEFLMVPE